MALNLLPNPGNRGVKYDLLSKPAEVVDRDHLSKYFVLSEFNPKFTSGKNSFQVNGSVFLEPNTEILVECLDSVGENLYIEMARSTEKSPAQNYAYKESTAYILSVHVYGDTADGIGKLILYGTLRGSQKHVIWSSAITIDKTLKNVSKVRFYKRPSIEIESLLVPTLSDAVASSLNAAITFTGSFTGLPVTPTKGTNYNTVNRRNIDTDYRIIINQPTIGRSNTGSDAANSQMINSTIVLNINSIQDPSSEKNITPSATQSFIVKDVFNNKTIQIADPYVYTDTKNNRVVSLITNGWFTLIYPFVSYNQDSSSYKTSYIGSETVIMRSSYADITYRNIKTFSGNVARHKVYRKSLLSNADFQIIADEPLFINEFLKDSVTQNKYYEKMGVFYSPNHVRRYWITSSNDLTLTHTPDVIINSMKIDANTDLDYVSASYVIVKNDSEPINRSASYVPYDAESYLASSGSSYDSNFIPLKKDVQYILSLNTILEKKNNEDESKLEFYFTSSMSASRQEPTFTERNGILLGTIKATSVGVTKRNALNQVFFFTPISDLYGTLTVVPYKCKATLWNVSLRAYGDDGISPDVFTSRISWPVSIGNETYEVKAELFDINSSLIYSELQTLQNFDESGDSLIPYIPSSGVYSGSFGDAFISGSLVVSKSFYIWPNHGASPSPGPASFTITSDGQMIAPEMESCFATIDGTAVASGSRFIRNAGPGHSTPYKVCQTNVVQIRHDQQYIYLCTASAITPSLSNLVLTKKSLASEYEAGSGYGRRVYVDAAGVVQTES